MNEVRRWAPLAGLVAVVMGLAGAGVLPRWSGLVYQVGLPPLDLLADVRVLTAEAGSPVVFVLGLAASVAVRSIVLALLLGWSRARLTFALRFYAAALAPALLAAALDFSGRAVLYAYLAWAGAGVLVLTSVALAPAPWTGTTRLRAAIGEALLAGLRIGVLLPYGLALALVIVVVPRSGAWTIAAVPVSALLTVLAARRLTVTPVRVGVGGVAAPACSAVVLALVLVIATVAGDADTPPRPERRGGSLVLVAGVDTTSGSGAMYRFDPRALGFSCVQTHYFSYAGPGDGAPQRDARCPIQSGARYAKRDTLRPVRELADTFAEQIADLPGPVVVVTHSQAAWIAWEALARDGASDVRALVMLAPFGETLVAYPSDGEDGAGIVGGAAARVVTSIGRSIGFNDYDPDRPLPRELQGTADAAQRLFARALPTGVRTLAVLSRWDVPIEPEGGPDDARTVCPGWANHGALPTSADAMHATARFLDGRDPGDCPDLTEAVTKLLASMGAPPPE